MILRRFFHISSRSVRQATLTVPSIRSLARISNIVRTSENNPAPIAVSLTPRILLSHSNQRGHNKHNALKYGLPAMAFLAALVEQNQDMDTSAACSPDISSFNFIADAAAIASPSVVNIVVNMSAGGLGIVGQSSGSGFIIDSAGLVATNAHVVTNSLSRGSSLTVTLHDGRKFPAKVHSLDRQLDIALIQLEVPRNTELPVSQIGHSGGMRAGEWVVALGSPLRLQNTVTAGILSSTARGASEIGFGDKDYEYLQTDAAINQGNSGGPLVNLRGEVIGINTAKLGGNLVSGISFAIPMDVAWQVIKQLRMYGNVRRPYLGIKFVTHNTARLPGGRYVVNPRDMEGKPDDVKIAEVIPGSPADQAGLQEGDVIVEFDHRKVTKIRDIIERLGYEYGRTIELKIRRDGSEQTMTVVSSKPNGYGR